MSRQAACTVAEGVVSLYRFRVIETEDSFLGGRSYGIVGEESCSAGWVPAACVPNISCRLPFVTQLAERCNRYQLSPVHLRDVVMDAIP